jgi:hypothetical protein
MSRFTVSQFGPEQVPDDISQAARRVGLEVCCSSDLANSCRFYCLRFLRGPGRVIVFERSGFDFDKCFARGREYLECYGRLTYSFRVWFTKTFFGDECC